MVAMPALDLKALERDRAECWSVFYEHLPKWIEQGLNGQCALIGPDLGKGRDIQTFETLWGAGIYARDRYSSAPYGCLIWTISKAELDEANRPINGKIPANTNTPADLEQIL